MTTAVKSTIQSDFKKQMDYGELLNCTRCGFCQPTCPTYVETGGKEASSPRGRIALMKAVVDGMLEPDEHFEKELSLCLGCRACETACPSGVNYGQLLEEARNIVAKHKIYPWPIKLIRNLFFKKLFPKPDRMRWMGIILWIYQKSGLQWVVRKSKLLNLFPNGMADMESILPNISSPKVLQTGHTTEKKSGIQKIGLIKGCIMDVLYFDTNQNTIRLIEESGYQVEIPSTQTCCGALHAHAGEKELAKKLAKQNIAAFEKENVDFIISNAGGCGAFLVEYEHLLKDDPEWMERASPFVAKIKDISEFLFEYGNLSCLQNAQQKITYQDSCHLKHGMKVDSSPRALLKKIQNVQYIELIDAGMCCGSAGIYNLIETEMSMQILDHKMENIKNTDACTILTSNPGCLLQMQLGIKRAGLENKMKAVHIVDFLAESLKKHGKDS
jgi:glycolate oxidase iron-sulfur subunit